MVEEAVSAPESGSGSSWCPPIYFNHKCYSSSFLSKARLAGLPQSVGPGPVRLVMREVMMFLIGSSYKSQSVLRRLGIKGAPRPDFVVEELKGKSRVLHLKANIEIPTRTDQVEAFCREVCSKVNACPYLISTKRYSEMTCPMDCQNRPKTEFKEEEPIHTPKTSSGKSSKKRRKRRNPDSLLLEEQRVDRDSSSSGDTTAASSRAASPDRRRRRYERRPWHSLLPKSEMKTRGAKLPDFKHWSKYKKEEKVEEKPVQDPEGDTLYSYHDRHVMQPVCVNVGGGGVRSTRRLELPAAFSMSDFPKPSTPKRQQLSATNGPPPIREIKLALNPELWTPVDTMKFLAQTSDCQHLAPFMVQDDIDGHAFMLLNYPTVKSYWKLKTETAIHLCQHVESVRLAHIKQF